MALLNSITTSGTSVLGPIVSEALSLHCYKYKKKKESTYDGSPCLVLSCVCVCVCVCAVRQTTEAEETHESTT